MPLDSTDTLAGTKENVIGTVDIPVTTVPSDGPETGIPCLVLNSASVAHVHSVLRAAITLLKRTLLQANRCGRPHSWLCLHAPSGGCWAWNEYTVTNHDTATGHVTGPFVYKSFSFSLFTLV